MAKKNRTTESSAKTKESCVSLYPWTLSEEQQQNKTVFNDSYVEHMSRLKTDSNPSLSTLTTIACGVLPNVTKELIEEFCERGVSMVVFDFDGLSYDQCEKMVNEIRQGVFTYSLHKNNRVPYSLALVLDLGGPCITTGTVFNSKNNPSLIELPTNDHVYLTNDIDYKDKCTEDCVYVSSDSILRLKEKDRIYLDYKIELAVERVDPDQVYCVIKRGELLGSQKVVHIPGIPIGVTALTKEDEMHVRTGIQLKVDAIMIPGVRNAAFFNCVKKFVNKEKGKTIDLLAKIDNSVGLENIDEIISSADGVCLHRLNLSMEIGYGKIILVQKMILSKCNIVGKPVVTYGGFLNSMEFSTVPSSAEVNDVITAVLDGTDGIYLDVTTRSPHSVHCAQYASLLCRQGEAAVWDQQLYTRLMHKSESKTDPGHGMCIGSVAISLTCNVAAIIAITTTGQSAKTIARYRPKCPVLAVVRHGKCARKLSVWRNLLALHYIDPIVTDWSREVENCTQFAMNFARKKGILNQGDLVLHMSCSKPNADFVNTMNLFYVSAGDLIED